MCRGKGWAILKEYFWNGYGTNCSFESSFISFDRLGANLVELRMERMLTSKRTATAKVQRGLCLCKDERMGRPLAVTCEYPWGGPPGGTCVRCGDGAAEEWGPRSAQAPLVQEVPAHLADGQGAPGDAIDTCVLRLLKGLCLVRSEGN